MCHPIGGELTPTKRSETDSPPVFRGGKPLRERVRRGLGGPTRTKRFGAEPALRRLQNRYSRVQIPVPPPFESRAGGTARRRA